MKIAIPDDYQDAVRTLDCFQKLNEQHVVIIREHISDPKVLAARLQGVEALVLIRERTPITEALLARLPDLRLIVQTGKRAPHLDLAACTPHLGYVEKDSYESLFGAAFDQLLDFAAGNRMNVANPEALKHV